MGCVGFCGAFWGIFSFVGSKLILSHSLIQHHHPHTFSTLCPPPLSFFGCCDRERERREREKRLFFFLIKGLEGQDLTRLGLRVCGVLLTFVVFFLCLQVL